MSSNKPSENLLRGAAAAADGDDGSRAWRAVRELEQRLAQRSSMTEAEIALELTQGSELAKAQWIEAGLLVGGSELERAWSSTAEGLRNACKRGDLFSIEFGDADWYPSVFVTLDAKDVSGVCRALRGLDAASMFVFWHRKHGSLGGKTLSEAFHGGQSSAVLNLACSYAAESLRD